MEIVAKYSNDEAIWNEKKDGGFMDKTIQFRRNNIRQQIGCFL
jgi:predicted Rdx family selenoprotein